ncbi:hypothetical protein AGMMS49960_00640 [Betaproteobacteria bacterium]|nr:hypothetical protein AGMMS49543_07020 [Betaproteobacteria bacterium]GHT98142.1 hypothetical protein AGMMS49960_00640 [Betaproteobacteria bacterium]
MKKEYDFSGAKRGAVTDGRGKTRITILIDDDVLGVFRNRAASEGKGYQTLINDALRGLLSADAAPVTVESLRRVLREELHAA